MVDNGDGKSLELPVTLASETCPVCGVRFAVPDYYQKQRKEDHCNFYCPNGDKQYYGGTNGTDLLKKYKKALDDISKLEVATLFNKDTLMLAIKLAQLALAK